LGFTLALKAVHKQRMKRFSLMTLWVWFFSFNALAQGPAMGPGMAPPPQVELSKEKVKRLLSVLPKIAQESAAMQKASNEMLLKDPTQAKAQMEKVKALFQKHGYSFEDFSAEMSALMATYWVLNPKAYEKELSAANNPEYQKIMNDPNIPQEQKKMMQTQFKMLQENQGAFLKQLGSMVSEGNRRAVKPFMADIEKLMKSLSKQSRAW
jgi:hypothetical protein